jgi:hypothetical protein
MCARRILPVIACSRLSKACSVWHSMDVSVWWLLSCLHLVLLYVASAALLISVRALAAPCMLNPCRTCLSRTRARDCWRTLRQMGGDPRHPCEFRLLFSRQCSGASHTEISLSCTQARQRQNMGQQRGVAKSAPQLCRLHCTCHCSVDIIKVVATQPSTQEYACMPSLWFCCLVAAGGTCPSPTGGRWCLWP